MIVGRIKIWYATKKKQVRPFYGGLFGREVVRRLENTQSTSDESSGCFHIARSKKGLQHIAENHCPFALLITNDGFTTCWFWRFFLTIRTPEFLKRNPW